MMETGHASPAQVKARRTSRTALAATGRITEGWVLLGHDLYYRVLRGAVEHAHTMNVKDGWARIWLDDPSRPAQEGLERITHYREVFQEDFVLGQGLDWSVYRADTDECPIVLDWGHLARELKLKKPRIVRDRRDKFQIVNMKYLLKYDWFSRLKRIPDSDQRDSA